VKARHLLLFFLATVASVLYAVSIRQVYTWRGNTHPDFYIEWMGSRVALEGGNPYSEETTVAIQTGSKGQRIPPNKDQLAFVYPFYRIFLNAPLAFLPYEWATAIWQTVMQVCLLVGVLLFVRSLGWQAMIGDLALIALVTVAAYPTFGGLALGQMAVGVLALLLVAFWALRQGHDWIAGSSLALATVKPQLIALIVPGLLLWCLLQRRWRVVLAFAVTLGLLSGASFAMLPSWLGEFARGIMRYSGYKNVQTGPSYLLDGCCGQIWPWLLEMAVLAWLLAGWWLVFASKARDRDGEEDSSWLEGAFVLTMALTCFLLPQTSVVNQLVLLPAILLLMRDAHTLATRAAVAVVSVAGSWAAYAYLYRTHYDLNMALPPFVVLLALAAWYVGKRWKDVQRATATSETA
jgi:hypothetical protein